MIVFKTLDKKQLQEFVDSGVYKNYDFLPITKHRAFSQTKNPKADENDVLLILAFENEKLAGYLGTFPDNFSINGENIKYAWLSTLFVSEHFRGKRIAQQLLEKAFESYDGNIAITEFTKEAESLYNKTKLFNYIHPKKGKRYYFRTDFETIIPSKKPKIAKLKPLFSLVDFFANTVISIKNKFNKKPEFHFEILDKIDAESSTFINLFQKNRNSSEINWFIENPWVLENNSPFANYLFSSFSQEFKYFWIKIFNKNKEIETCALLQLRDGHLKIPYLFSSKNLNKMASFLSHFIVEKKVKILTSYHPKLNEIMNHSTFKKLYKKDFERRYLFHKNLLQNLPENFNPNYQDGDGDCALT